MKMEITITTGGCCEGLLATERHTLLSHIFELSGCGVKPRGLKLRACKVKILFLFFLKSNFVTG